MSYHDDKDLYEQNASLDTKINSTNQEWARFQSMLMNPGVSEQDKARYGLRCNQLHDQLKYLQGLKIQVERSIYMNEQYRRDLGNLHEQHVQARKAHEENVRALQSYHEGFRVKREVDKNRNRPL
jgi:hypothetical protein